LDLTINIENSAKSAALYGPTDANLRKIREAFDVKVTARDGAIHLSGSSDAVRRAAEVLDALQQRLKAVNELSDEDLRTVIALADRPVGVPIQNVLEVFANGARIVPRTEGQARYVDTILKCDLTFCLGPAGTGKTYLAVAVATTMLKRKAIARIVLVRPAVEAGEKLGYLPGDIQAKVNPYLRPLFDALHDMMGFDQAKRLMENDIIEVIPLAFMRGRTLNQSVIILDEAQNTTVSQMLMFLTRLGTGSKMIVTGDDSQTDLSPGQRSGVLDAVNRLANEPLIGQVRLGREDIVRHPLVQRIVQAYHGQSGSS